jgi:hypothetical protein
MSFVSLRAIISVPCLLMVVFSPCRRSCRRSVRVPCQVIPAILTRCPQVKISSKLTSSCSTISGLSRLFSKGVHEYLKSARRCVRVILRTKYSQKPQLSSSHPIVSPPASFVDWSHRLLVRTRVFISFVNKKERNHACVDKNVCVCR